MIILLLGSNGQLGKELERHLYKVGKVIAFDKDSLNIANHKVVKKVILSIKPDIIVNAAAYTAVDKAETDIQNAYAINDKAVANLAKIAKTENLWFIHYSTDYVFDGSKQKPYLEIDTPNPINIYGASKLAGENAILSSGCNHTIFRTTWVIGKDGKNFAKTIIQLAKSQSHLSVIYDQLGVPTSPLLISKVTIDAIQAFKNKRPWENGIYNLTPTGVSSWYDIAKLLVTNAEQSKITLKATAKNIQAIKSNDLKLTAKRPLNSLLNTNKLQSKLSFDLPDWKDDFISVSKNILREKNIEKLTDNIS